MLKYKIKRRYKMKKISLSIVFISSTLLYGFDFGGLANDVLKAQTAKTQKSEPATTATKSLSDTTVTSGLKEALKVGIDYGVKALSKKDGYLNNKDVKIPLPKNLSKAETLIRKAGGDKIADDLILSMNNAATQAAPKTAAIFVDAVDKMSLDDAQKILAGDKDAATNYFKTHTSDSLTKMIQPIVQKSMKDNNVASYYDSFNSYYKTYAKDMVNNSSVMSMAKGFGVDQYLPSSSDENLDAYVTQKAMDGLFKMIATKESAIRDNPLQQTTSLLKKVFGK